MKEFFKENRKAFYITLLYTFFCFGFMLLHYTVSIDEETWVLRETESNLWLLQNRYSIHLYNLIFTEHGRFIPFFSEVVSIILWNLSGCLFAYVFFDFEKKNKLWIRVFLLCYYSSIPFCVGEAFAFTMQMIPETLGMVSVALAFILTVRKKTQREYWNEIWAVVLLVFALGAYQALIGVYITAVAGWCLCRFLEEKKIKRELIKGIIVTVISMIFYYIINFAIAKSIGAASYLSDNYIGWTSEDGILSTLFFALANVGRVSLAITYEGVYIYGGTTLCVVMVLFILFSIYMFFSKKGIRKKAGVFFFTVALVMAPFSLYIALGTYKTHGRLLIALSLSGMIELLLILNCVKKELSEKVVGIVTAGVLLVNAANMNQIYYDSYLVYQHDKSIAEEIMYDIRRWGCDYHNKPVVFVGMVKMDDIGLKESGTLGGSVFEWDGGNISRMSDFIRTEGYQVQMPNGQQIEEGLALTENMTLWPQEGSVLETDDIIVVYLSEPGEEWYKTNLGR